MERNSEKYPWIWLDFIILISSCCCFLWRHSASKSLSNSNVVRRKSTRWKKAHDKITSSAVWRILGMILIHLKITESKRILVQPFHGIIIFTSQNHAFELGLAKSVIFTDYKHEDTEWKHQSVKFEKDMM